MLLRILVTKHLTRSHSELVQHLEAHAVVLRSRGRRDLWTKLRQQPIDVVLARPADLGADPASALKDLDAAPRRPQVVLAVADVGSWGSSAAIVLPGGLALERQIDVLRHAQDVARERRLQRGRARQWGLEPTLAAFGNTSRSAVRFHEEARQAAGSDAPILIQGEPGAGRSWLGLVLHKESPRTRQSFQRICFAGLEPASVEMELFGHEPNSVPGKTRAGRSLLEKAHKRSLFLEHVDRAPTDVQVRLAETFNRGSIRPIGVAHDVAINVRLIASVSAGIDADTNGKSGGLEPSLRRRFELASFVVPPLRERAEDVPELAEAALASCRRRFGATARGFSSAVMEVLCQHKWPGNINELWTVVERAALVAKGEDIKLENLPAEVPAGRNEAVQGIYVDAPWLGEAQQLPSLRDVRSAVLEVVDRAYVDRLLQATGGRVGDAAQMAGIDPRSLCGLMRRHSLNKADYKRRPEQGSGPAGV